jgi:hypothetical protein
MELRGTILSMTESPLLQRKEVACMQRTMKIIGFVRNSEVDFGLVAEEGGIQLFDDHAELGLIPVEVRLNRLLCMSPEERRRVCIEMAGAPTVEREAVECLAAIPQCPVYILAHGNNPTVWKRQMGRDWEMPRVPFMRVRSFNSYSGDGWEMPLPTGGSIQGGRSLEW